MLLRVVRSWLLRPEGVPWWFWGDCEGRVCGSVGGSMPDSPLVSDLRSRSSPLAFVT